MKNSTGHHKCAVCREPFMDPPDEFDHPPFWDSESDGEVELKTNCRIFIILIILNEMF